MICKKCGAEIDNDALFCTECGTETNEKIEKLAEEDRTNFPTDIYSSEFEYTKKIFNIYYKKEFVQRSLVSYIILQILTLCMFTFPGILFAIIYWLISNPITKGSLWRATLYENKGRLPLYRFFFSDDSLIVRRNRNEELVMKYKDFKKIIIDKKGILFLSKKHDFFLPIEEIRNIDEIKEILKVNKNCKVK